MGITRNSVCINMEPHESVAIATKRSNTSYCPAHHSGRLLKLKHTLHSNQWCVHSRQCLQVGIMGCHNRQVFSPSALAHSFKLSHSFSTLEEQLSRQCHGTSQLSRPPVCKRFPSCSQTHCCVGKLAFLSTCKPSGHKCSDMLIAVVSTPTDAAADFFKFKVVLKFAHKCICDVYSLMCLIRCKGICSDPRSVLPDIHVNTYNVCSTTKQSQGCTAQVHSLFIKHLINCLFSRFCTPSTSSCMRSESYLLTPY